MFNPQNQFRKPGGGPMGSVDGTAKVLGFVVAVLATPTIYDLTVAYFSRVIVNGYGSEFLDLFQLGWFGVLGLLTYNIARVAIAPALLMAGTALAMRLI
ncbi:hypothetical protein A7A08_02349 [Methyloligella halotolerans]|uniref:Uncharacterized protein n=1 Tax=Methyloligella halotolerans TaxID=1177755 RepID=A0A1E2RWR1_9HYPH|nr:hypothetical protein [Methyloligella halotolerans]ODA66582.1 hypothetical protein A7A08_02349 [Methyloligella halotolerans]